MATHSSVLAWRIPWTEKLGRLQFVGWQRVGHDRVTNTHTVVEPRFYTREGERGPGSTGHLLL